MEKALDSEREARQALPCRHLSIMNEASKRRQFVCKHNARLLNVLIPAFTNEDISFCNCPEMPNKLTVWKATASSNKQSKTMTNGSDLFLMVSEDKGLDGKQTVLKGQPASNASSESLHHNLHPICTSMNPLPVACQKPSPEDEDADATKYPAANGNVNAYAIDNDDHGNHNSSDKGDDQGDECGKFNADHDHVFIQFVAQLFAIAYAP